MFDWNAGEDRKQAGGFKISLSENPRGVCVRYTLLVRRTRRFSLTPSALVVRCYENGDITLDETTWEG